MKSKFLNFIQIKIIDPMFPDDFTDREKWSIILAGVIFASAIVIFLSLPLFSGYIKEKADSMIVVEKYEKNTPVRVNAYWVTSTFATVDFQPSDTEYYIKTKRNIDVYKTDKNDFRTFVRQETETKSYRVSKDVYDNYKVGETLVFDSVNDIWCPERTAGND